MYTREVGKPWTPVRLLPGEEDYVRDVHVGLMNPTFPMSVEYRDEPEQGQSLWRLIDATGKVGSWFIVPTTWLRS